MKQKHNPGLGSEVEQHGIIQTAASLSPARTARDARADGGQEAAESWASGAPSSNTAPDNSNRGEAGFFKALRWGVDSLYLSYPGKLSKESDSLLKELKLLAQSNNPDEVGKAQLALGSHVFEVKEKGASLFPYILEDGAFRIQLSRPGHKAPMAYVKVSAKYLAHVGPVEAERHLHSLLSELGHIEEAANVSRIDMYVDFQSSVDMESWDRHAWVTRASAINAYSVSGKFSGWSIGLGGVMSARLYNKLLEIIVSGKEWIIPLWQQAGWDGKGLIWRLEFEMKREVLSQRGLFKLSQVLNHLNGLWSYATTEWLRLTLPSEDDQTRSRWPIHPLWGLLSSVDWESEGGALAKRFTPTRSPEDDKLFEFGMSAILSFMAKHAYGPEELYEGAEAFLTEAYRFFHEKADRANLIFEDFIADKLALKRRQYNTLLNDPEFVERLKVKLKEREARAYRKASGG